MALPISRSLASLNVLVVEASPHWQKILKSVLHNVGFRDVTVVGKLNAKLGYRLKNADIVFVDCSLEDNNPGFTLVRKIRSTSEEEIAGTPIIMMSEQTTRETIMAAIRVGCNEFLEKPVVTARLLDRVRLVLDHPRDYIKLDNYFGPDRRRGIDPGYEIEDRRQAKS